MLGGASRCVVAKSMAPAMQQKQGRSALSHVINLLSCRYLPFRLAAFGFYYKAGALFLLRRSGTLRRAGIANDCRLVCANSIESIKKL